MAIALETGTSSSSSTSNTQTLVWSHTVSSGANFLVVVAGCGDDTTADRNITGVTFGGQSLTQLAQVDDASWLNCEMWYLANPTVSTNDITVTYAGAGVLQMGGGGVNFSGVDTASPWGTPVTAIGSGTTATVDVTGVNSGEWTIGGIASDAEGGITETGTLLWEVQNVGSDTSYGSQYKTSTGTVAMSWTQASTGWTVVSAALKPSGGGGGRTTKNTRSAPLGIEAGMNWRGGP